MKRSVVGALAAPAIIAIAACAPPPAANTAIKGCANGGAPIVTVTPSTLCPAHGWFVTDPRDGGATTQFFPAAPSIVTAQGFPSKTEDDQPANWTRVFYQRNTDGSVKVRTMVSVRGPAWMFDPTTSEIPGGYARDIGNV